MMMLWWQKKWNPIPIFEFHRPLNKQNNNNRRINIFIQLSFIGITFPHILISVHSHLIPLPGIPFLWSFSDMSLNNLLMTWHVHDDVGALSTELLILITYNEGRTSHHHQSPYADPTSIQAHPLSHTASFPSPPSVPCHHCIFKESGQTLTKGSASFNKWQSIPEIGCL